MKAKKQATIEDLLENTIQGFSQGNATLKEVLDYKDYLDPERFAQLMVLLKRTLAIVRARAPKEHSQLMLPQDKSET